MVAFTDRRNGQITSLSLHPVFDDKDGTTEPAPRSARRRRRRRNSTAKKQVDTTKGDYQNLLADLGTDRQITRTDAQQLLYVPASAV